MKEKNVNQNKEELEKNINSLLDRSISAVYPSKEELKKVLLGDRKLKIYIGLDATGPMLHIGHSTNFIFLQKLRELGHKIIILFGDFTAMIGDPTDKNATRTPLTSKEIEKNIETWKKQISPIFKGLRFQNPVKYVKNSTWLSKLSFKEIINLSSNFTVQQMIERDMFQKRIQEEKPIHLSEFLYPLIQGYDSVALDIDMEIGGNDQIFNMLAGRTLLKKYKNKEKFVVATSLLADPKTGKKLMNKSEGNFIGLLDEPSDMFGKIMALPDEAILPVFTHCTLVSMESVRELETLLRNGMNPKDAKLLVAEEVVSIYRGKEKAAFARENFIKTFSEKNVPKDIPEILCDGEDLLSESFIRAGVVDSKSEFGRLIKEGAISFIDPGENHLVKMTDIFAKAGKGGTYKIGKHRFVTIKVN